MEAGEDLVAAFREAMAANGLPTSERLIGDGKLHRCRIDGDRKGGGRPCWYVLHLDGRPNAVYGCNRRFGGQTIKWSAKGSKNLTRAERKALMAEMKVAQARRLAKEIARHDAAAARANEIWNAATDADPAHPYLVTKQVGTHALRQGVWVKEWHDERTGEVFEKRVENALLIPVKRSSKEIVSLQAIFPDANNAIGRGKDFLPGGAKRGCYFPIGKLTEVNGRKVVVFCEGYATGASVHEATGLGVIVAFDAGNLEPVAIALRAKLPDALFVFAADDDQWTERPVKNPGLTQANEAVRAAGGFVALPEFVDLQGRPTDFNDLMVREGAEAVRKIVMKAINSPAARTEQADKADFEKRGDDVNGSSAAEEGGEKKHNARKPNPWINKESADATTDVTPNALDGNPWFTALGYDHDYLYFFNHTKKMIQAVSEGYSAIKNKLLPVAPLQWWEREFPGNQSVNEKAAVNAVIRWSHRVGVFDPGIVRGRGAWIDDGRVVFHCGDKLLVNGVETDCAAIDSAFVYERGRHLASPAKTALSDEEGKKLFNLARQFRWERSSSSLLLLGWCALAPICGALEWRPHIWLTGGPGCGKTTVQERFIKTLTAGTALFVQGTTTEAGLRQEIRSDARPIQFDESEQNSEKDEARMQASIGFARQASSQTGAMVLKGSSAGQSMVFQPKPMICFSSVVMRLNSDADRDRIAVLRLKSRIASSNSAGEWVALSAGLAEINADKELSGRILRRVLDLLPTTLKNIKLFAQVCAEKFGSPREGDQYGTLLAGVWSLVSSREATWEDVERMLAKYDWSEYMEHTEADDAEQALGAVLSASISMPHGERATVHELLRAAAGLPTDIVSLTEKQALRELRAKAMTFVVDKERGPELLVWPQAPDWPELLNGTSYGMDLKGFLMRHKYGRKYPDKVSLCGNARSCIGIQIAEYLGEDGVVQQYEPGADIGAEYDAPF
jgi:putative DNA primase/helicase